MAPASPYIGRPMTRKEDPRLIQGLSHYVDDIQLPGTHFMAVVRSPYAHARIGSIDTSKAKSAPGAVAVVTGPELHGVIGVIPCAAQIPDMKPAFREVLATDKVRFVGEPVAVVVASDRYAAGDAVDLVEVEYEPLPVVVDPEKAIAKGAPRLYDQFEDNVSYRWELEGGDVAGAFKAAEKIVSQRMVNQRLIPVPMEPRGVVAEYIPGENQLNIWTSTQIPHLARTQIAAMLNFPEDGVRVIAPEVGGGFGAKLNVYGEEALTAHLAIRLERPVKWIEGRREHFQCTIHGRDEINYMDVAAKSDGTVLGIRCRVIADLGAYYQLLTPMIPTLTGLMICGSYKIPAVRMEIIGALTNKMATDAYRGAGRPEATYFIERAMDLVAHDLKKDVVEVRRINFPKPKDFPYAVPTGLTYDSANYQKSLAVVLKMSGYTKLRAEQAALRRKGRYIGIGLSTYVEICAMGPSSAMPAGGWESATVRIEPTGKVNILTGSSMHGQGQETTHFFEPANFTFPFGAHVCVVEVDPETGDVKLEKYFAVDDCGNAINPLLIDGQVHGGIVQSVGQALFEEAVYDSEGQLITGEFTDYAIPRAHDIPRIRTNRTVTPSPVNPMGVKGVGEAGTIGATPALVNAVVDALAPFGVRHVDLPIKREKIWRLIHEASKSAKPPEKAAAKKSAKAPPKAASRKSSKAKARRK